MSEMRVAALQLALSDDMDKNIAAVSALVREAAAQDAKVILPPELFQGYYFCRHEHERFFTRAYPTASHPAVVAIARAISKRPDVLLCDEPTGALDVKTGAIVLEAIAKINRELGTLVVVITHNAAIASMANRVVYLSDGQIANIKVNPQVASASQLVW